MENMFCFQCQETAKNTGCTISGVCGKKPEVAAMQDLLVWVTKALSSVACALRAQGKSVAKEVNHRVTMNLFVTITNANFDNPAIIAIIKKTLEMKKSLIANLGDCSNLPSFALWEGDESEFTQKAREVGVLSTADEDKRSLRELTTYGLKGLAAYMKHANALNKEDESIDIFIQEALAKTLDDSLSIDDLIALAMETGKFGVSGMALLDSANTGAYGNPEISEVNIGVGKNPGI